MIPTSHQDPTCRHYVESHSGATQVLTSVTVSLPPFIFYPCLISVYNSLSQYPGYILKVVCCADMDWSTSLIIDRASSLLTQLSAIPRMTVCSPLSLETRELLGAGNITWDEARGLKLASSGLVASADDHDFCCPPVVDSSTWLGVVGGIAVVTFFLRQQITMGKRRRKRAVQETQGDNNVPRENSATYYYKVRKTVGDKLIPEEDFEFMKEEKHIEDIGGAGDCRLELWRCLSGSIEDGVRMFDSRSRMMEVAGSLMTKLAFHGPRQSVWQSIMSLPKVWTKEYHSNKIDIYH